MENSISPLYLMTLIQKISDALWAKFPSSKYKNVRYYIEKWHDDDGNFWENFHIWEDENGNINLDKTLHGINGELLLKIAIDLGIETPYFIPCVPTFKNTLKDQYKSAHEAFNKAITNIEEQPDIAIGLANSALESIIKTILNDGILEVKYNPKDTLYNQTQAILKAFEIYPTKQVSKEIKIIGSSILAICQSIEDMRSKKTNFHGSTDDEEIISESLYAYFVVNSISTLGLFLDNYYKLRFLPECKSVGEPIFEGVDLDDLPF